MDEIRDAARYNYLRDRDLDTITKGGVFAGMTPKNVILNGVDLDDAIDKAMGLQPTPVWTVLLLRPDYIADTYGQDTMLLQVEAATVDSAIEKAQIEAVMSDSPLEGGDLEDYYPLLCIRGRHEDLKP